MSTAIEWTDETWNPVSGCTKVSAGCKHCYAETVANRFWAAQYPTVPTTEREREDGLVDVDHLVTRPRRFSDVMTHEDRLFAPLSWRKPRRVFVNSMSDLFHESVPLSFIERVWRVMLSAPRHTFQVLTKRPERMAEVVPALYFRIYGGSYPAHIALPSWIWLGVSCENQETADERIPWLLQTPAAVRFVSAEPLLKLTNLTKHMPKPMFYCGRCGKEKLRPYCSPCGLDLETVTNEVIGLDWVIVGGESGPKARPADVEWIRSIVRQCQRACVPVFVKQLGARPVVPSGRLRHWEWGGQILSDREARFVYDQPSLAGPLTWRVVLDDRKGGDPVEWPEDLRVREWPRRAA